MLLSQLVKAINKGGNNMKVKVQLRYSYNQELYYPIDSNAAIFAELIGTKTLPKRALKLIEKLGYEIEVEQPTPKGWDRV